MRWCICVPSSGHNVQCIWKNDIYLSLNSNKSFLNINFFNFTELNQLQREFPLSLKLLVHTGFFFLQVRLNLGMYIVFILDWLTVFHRDQILVLRLEDYAANLKMAIKAVFDFLSVGTCHRVTFSLFITLKKSRFLQPWASPPPCRSSVPAGGGGTDPAADAEHAASCWHQPGAHAFSHQTPAQGIPPALQP